MKTYLIVAVVVSILSVISTGHAVSIGSCSIQTAASNALATATFRGTPRITSSCVVNENCNNEVHVIGNYEGNGFHSFRIHETGFTNFYLRVTGSSSRRLILVLSSYEPVQWTLHIPAGVVIDRVILSSFHNNSVVYTPGQVLAVENTLRYFAYSSSRRTPELLTYLNNRFGAVSSFTGTYSADEWRLTINRQSPCTTAASTAVTTEAPTTPNSTSRPTVLVTTQPIATTSTTTSVSSSSCPGSRNCLGNYCPGSYKTGARCINGLCQCPNSPMRDRCSCLSIIGSCHIRNEASNAVASATYRGSPPRNGYTTYSCVANDNCENEVHVIGNYEGNGRHGYRVTRTTGNTNLYLTVTGSSSRPLILVLTSYEPVRWTLHIPTGVVINRVVLSSFYNNSIIAPPGRVLAVENNLRFFGYGKDDGGGRTHELLTNLYNRFGPVSSFTGTYQADVWRLHINRRSPDRNCLSSPFRLPGSTSRPTVTTQPIATTSTTTSVSSSSCPGSRNCLGNYCPSSYKTGARCINGLCQCPNNPMRDRCSCLSIIGSCHIRNEASNAVASATYRGSPPRYGYTTYSCVANDNCENEVHVIGNYEGNGRHGFGITRTTGNTNLYLTVTGSSSRRLILVLSSYEPVRWTLRIPTGVVIDRVILSSYYNNSIIAPPGRVLAVENNLRLYGYGKGGRTHELLTNLYNRFGPVSSLTGTYQADVWRLRINRRNPDRNCLSSPFRLPGSTSRPTVTTQPIATTSTTTSVSSSSCPGSRNCLGNYCPGSYKTGARCINGLCQCPNNPMRDRCSCLSIIGSCHIRNEASNAIASATYRGSPPRYGYTTYSCVANDNCENEVHVIGNYEGNGRHGFGVTRTTGNTNLYLTVTGSSSRRLILVLTSYEPVRWRLHIPTGVVIDRVILSAYYTNSIIAPPGQVLAVENTSRLSGYGKDDGGGDTHEILTNLYNRFGPVSSFTGTYQADVWRLRINRRSPDRNCLSSPFQLPASGNIQVTNSVGARVTEGSPSSSTFVPAAVWYALGIGISLFSILVTVVLIIIRRVVITKRLSAARATPTTQRMEYNLTTQMVTNSGTLSPSPPHSQADAQKNEVTASLSAGEPPSYAEVEGNRYNYATGGESLPSPPPPYHTLN